MLVSLEDILRKFETRSQLDFFCLETSEDLLSIRPGARGILRPSIWVVHRHRDEGSPAFLEVVQVEANMGLPEGLQTIRVDNHFVLWVSRPPFGGRADGPSSEKGQHNE